MHARNVVSVTFQLLGIFVLLATFTEDSLPRTGRVGKAVPDLLPHLPSIESSTVEVQRSYCIGDRVILAYLGLETG